MARGLDFGAWFSDGEARWTTPRGTHRLRFPAGKPEAEQPLAARINYIGRGQARTFARVVYRQVAPGIDAVFYGNARQQLEYDLLVAPGADLAALVVDLGGPRKAPVAYQEVDGVRKPVAARYRRLGGSRAGFEVGRYDRTRPLVIDPVLTLGTYLGGVGGGTGESIAIDPQGYIYVTGITNTNHLPVANALQWYFAGSNDVYVSKFDPTGMELIYSTYLGSWGDDRALDIAVDAQGCAYVTGHTNSPDFPVTDGAFQTKYAGGSIVNGGDAFVLKLSPNGDRLVWSTYFGGSKDEYARSIAVDPAGFVYITGSVLSDDMPVLNAEQPNLAPTPEGIANYVARDTFVAKFTPDGAALVYSTYLGGPAIDEGWAIAVDSNGYAWMAASTQSIPGSSPVANGFPLKNQVQTNYGGSHARRGGGAVRSRRAPPVLHHLWRQRR